MIILISLPNNLKSFMILLNYPPNNLIKMLQYFQIIYRIT